MYLFDFQGRPMDLPPPPQPVAGSRPMAWLDAHQAIFGAWAGLWAEAAELPSGPRATPWGCAVFLVAAEAGLGAEGQAWGPARWALLPTETVTSNLAMAAVVRAEWYTAHFHQQYGERYYSHPAGAPMTA